MCVCFFGGVGERVWMVEGVGAGCRLGLTSTLVGSARLLQTFLPVSALCEDKHQVCVVA